MYLSSVMHGEQTKVGQKVQGAVTARLKRKKEAVI